ncbi:hypothetical protein CB1_000113005 [Camelus ferus]|nr:hypothetical protein CB1_000113005 [Camelus ferus]
MHVRIFSSSPWTLERALSLGFDKAKLKSMETYLKAVKLFRNDQNNSGEPEYSQVIQINLNSIVPSVSGPKRPQDRVAVTDMKSDFQACLNEKVGFKGFQIAAEKQNDVVSIHYEGSEYKLAHGSVVIAAVISCTNNCNPSVMLAAGLLAKKAVEAGLRVKPYIRTSLSPGSGMVTHYLSSSGVLPYLSKLGLTPREFNSYGARRGNDAVMTRGTFANIKLFNKFIGKPAPKTVHFPSGQTLDVFEAAELYQKEGIPLIILAGKKYGSGNSRDWAAKGPYLLQSALIGGGGSRGANQKSGLAGSEERRTQTQGVRRDLPAAAQDRGQSPGLLESGIRLRTSGRCGTKDTTDGPNECVLKINNTESSKTPDLIEVQSHIMMFLRAAGFPTASVYRTKGDHITSLTSIDSGSEIKSYLVRLLTYLPGRPIAEIPISSQLLYEIGRLAAKLDKTLENFHHPQLSSLHRENFIWNLKNVPLLEKYLYALGQNRKREIVEQVIQLFKDEVMTKLSHFRECINHGDLNDHNILIESSKSACGDAVYQVSGILDFDDMSYGYYVFEVAITIMYMMIESKTPIQGQPYFSPVCCSSLVTGYLAPVLAIRSAPSKIALSSCGSLAQHHSVEPHYLRGRLYQVEYAMEAIGHAGTCLGILANDGVLLAAERRNIHKLLDEVFFSEKIYKLNEDMACSVAGITSDANVLTNELRLIAQRYLLQYQEPIPCEQLVTALCDIKQAYTQFGGKRPFGVSLLYIGWDKHYGFQLYQSDPSGNYGGWKATCIGNNSAAAVSMLKQDYKEGEMTLKSALALAIKVLNKTMDVSKLSAEKVEIATLTRENGKTVIRVLKQKEVEQLIKKHEEEEAKAEREKKEKEQKEKDK